MSETIRGVPVLKLWPLEWVANAPTSSGDELAALWQPQLCGVLFDSIIFRGLEPSASSPRQWLAQRWLCEILDAPRARSYFQEDKRFGEVTARSSGREITAPEGKSR